MQEWKDGHSGGKVNVLDFGSKKSPRVQKSTFGGELAAATVCLERAELLQIWTTEIFQGRTADPKDMLSRNDTFTNWPVIDAGCLFDEIVSKEIGEDHG